MKSHNWLKTTKPVMFRSKTYTKAGDTHSYKIKPSEGSQSYDLSLSSTGTLGSLNSLVFIQYLPCGCFSPSLWTWVSLSTELSLWQRTWKKNPGALEMFTVLRSRRAAEGLQAHSWSPSSHPPTGVWSTNKETLHHHELMSKKGP